MGASIAVLTAAVCALIASQDEGTRADISDCYKKMRAVSADAFIALPFVEGQGVYTKPTLAAISRALDGLV